MISCKYKGGGAWRRWNSAPWAPWGSTLRPKGWPRGGLGAPLRGLMWWLASFSLETPQRIFFNDLIESSWSFNLVSLQASLICVQSSKDSPLPSQGYSKEQTIKPFFHGINNCSFFYQNKYGRIYDSWTWEACHQSNNRPKTLNLRIPRSNLHGEEKWSLYFRSPLQNWESPCLGLTPVMCWFFWYLFFKIDCHMPFEL